MNSASQELAHQADGFALEVFRGRFPRLTPTRNIAFVPRDVLEQPYEGYSLLETTQTGVYWILKNGQRRNNRCYCQVCRTSFNGSGSNIKAHIAKHQGSKQYSDDQKMFAAFLFLIKHSIGFTTFRDPLVKIFLPQMSSSVIEQLLVRGCTGVHAMIQKELENRDVTVMIDGSCDASLRRFLGVALAYYNETRNTIVHRLLDLGHGIAGRHTAAQLTTFLRNWTNSRRLFARAGETRKWWALQWWKTTSGDHRRQSGVISEHGNFGRDFKFLSLQKEISRYYLFTLLVELWHIRKSSKVCCIPTSPAPQLLSGSREPFPLRDAICRGHGYSCHLRRLRRFVSWRWTSIKQCLR